MEAMGSLTGENVDDKEVVLPEKKPDFLNLSIVAKAETWIKVIIDEEKPLEYLLKPGDKIALNAKSHYNFLIGNAGGVQLNLNGQPVQIPGKMGQVVTLSLP
jgi:cytoskeleton protein RodZ